jgi:hypothetical protein
MNLNILMSALIVVSLSLFLFLFPFQNGA